MFEKKTKIEILIGSKKRNFVILFEMMIKKYNIYNHEKKQ